LVVEVPAPWHRIAPAWLCGFLHQQLTWLCGNTGHNITIPMENLGIDHSGNMACAESELGLNVGTRRGLRAVLAL